MSVLKPPEKLSIKTPTTVFLRNTAICTTATTVVFSFTGWFLFCHFWRHFVNHLIEIRITLNLVQRRIILIKLFLLLLIYKSLRRNARHWGLYIPKFLT